MGRNTLNRTVEFYRAELVDSTGNPYNKYFILEEFIKEFFIEYSLQSMKNGYTVNSEKKCWVDLVNENTIDNFDCIEVKLTYSKFNKKVKVIKVGDRSIVGGKDLDEGDEEKQHFVIKFFPNSNCALIIFEKILDSVSVTFIKRTLNTYLKNIFIKSDSYKDKIKYRDIKLNIDPIISGKFLESIGNLKGTKLLKAIVTKESIDEDIRFSGNHARSESDLIVKADKGFLIPNTDVETYCKKFLTNGIIKSNKIIRIVIDGVNELNNPVKLDTEGMKFSEKVRVNLDSDRAVDTDDIFDKFNNLIISKDDELKKFFDATLNEVALDLNEQE
ncbi:MAG: hypothetical protein RR904_06130 [Bacilli bacterium]